MVCEPYQSAGLTVNVHNVSPGVFFSQSLSSLSKLAIIVVGEIATLQDSPTFADIRNMKDR